MGLPRNSWEIELIVDGTAIYDEGMKPKRFQITTRDLVKVTAIAAVSLFPHAIYRDLFGLVLSAVVFSLLLPVSFAKFRVAVGIFTLVIVPCVSLLLILPAPSSVSPGARQNGCINQVRMLSIAIANYESANGPLPAFVPDENGEPMHSWRVLVLPYAEEVILYEDYDFSKPWDAPENLALPMPEWFSCPADFNKVDQTTCYVAVTGPGTVWDHSVGSVVERIRIIESPADRQHWLDPNSPTLDEVLRRKMPFETPHTSGDVIAAFTNGHSATIPKLTTVERWRKLFTGK